MGLVIKANGVKLPSPSKITSTNEIIWSSATGRSSTGKMLGDIVAEKQTFSIVWEFLTKAQQKQIVKYMKAGFFPVQFIFDDETVELSSYRGTITNEHLGYVGDGNYYFRSVTCDVIER